MYGSKQKDIVKPVYPEENDESTKQLEDITKLEELISKWKYKCKSKFHSKRKYTLKKGNKKYIVKPVYPEDYDEFTKLLEDNKEIKDLIDRRIFYRIKYRLPRDTSNRKIHEMFIKKCQELNIQENEYPFNTLDKGKKSLYRYRDSLIEYYFRNYTK